MKNISALILDPQVPSSSGTLEFLKSLRRFDEIKNCESGRDFARSLLEMKSDFILLIITQGYLEISNEAIHELIREMEAKDAGIVYSDYICNGSLTPLNDYLPGSFRDDFDFGGILLLSGEKVRKVLEKYKGISFLKHGFLYELRLKISLDYQIVHVPRALYSIEGHEERSAHDSIFSYVDEKNLEYQKEMEAIFTCFLKEKGAYIPPHFLKNAEPDRQDYPCDLSVIIPVKNRERTISQALESALSQKTDFKFNILVVDNHSEDKTPEIVDAISRRNPSVIRITPERRDLEIGGCWNEAVNSPFCGRYVVQLDSDDLYAKENALQMVFDKLREGRYAMVVGTYRTVDENLKEVPPGIVSHREWSYENGHNNLLRVGGIGAPRAYQTSILRKIGFKNIGYGEDYEIALRISREYRIGRIYECIYLARRWSDNTDSKLDPLRRVALNEIKDRIRTKELEERVEYLKRVKTLGNLL